MPTSALNLLRFRLKLPINRCILRGPICTGKRQITSVTLLRRKRL